MYMPVCEGHQFLMVVFCYLSGWVEARPLRTLTFKAVARFLWKDVICCYCCFGKLIIDGDLKNEEAVEELEEKYGIKRVVVSAYHS